MSILPQNTPLVNIETESDHLARKQRLDALSGLGTNAILGRDPQAVTLKFHPGGVIGRKPQASSIPPTSNGRGVIKGFSFKSRRRLREKLIAIDWGQIIPPEGQSKTGYFLTLTYPRQFPDDWQDWKRDLRAFIRRVERRFDLQALLWKLEIQRREAPHFHIVLILRSPVDKRILREWVSLNWFQVVASDDVKHLRAGTNVRPLYGKAGKLLRYLSKYFSKPWQAAKETGRVWGIIGDLPIGDVLTVTLSWRRWCQFARRVRRWGKKSRYLARIDGNTSGFLVFGDRQQLTQLLRGLWASDLAGVT
jgi:hypothetical protein